MEDEGSSSFPNGKPDDGSSSDSDDTSPVEKIMRDVIPEDVTISEEVKELVANCVVGFIAFVTNEANEQCKKEDRAMVTSEDLILAMSRLGFDDYAELLTKVHNRIHGDADAPIDGDNNGGDAHEGVTLAAGVNGDGEVIIVDRPIISHAGGDDDETDHESDESESDDESDGLSD